MTVQQDTIESGQAPRMHRRCGSIDCAGGGYVVATVVAFMVFWPLGLAMLVWAFQREIRRSSWWQRLRNVRAPAAPDLSDLWRRRPDNEALAEYLGREQQRLREEQQKLDELVRAFEAFKDAERKARDRQDFETFMRQRQADDEGPTTQG